VAQLSPLVTKKRDTARPHTPFQLVVKFFIAI